MQDLPFSAPCFPFQWYPALSLAQGWPSGTPLSPPPAALTHGRFCPKNVLEHLWVTPQGPGASCSVRWSFQAASDFFHFFFFKRPTQKMDLLRPLLCTLQLALHKHVKALEKLLLFERFEIFEILERFGVSITQRGRETR